MSKSPLTRRGKLRVNTSIEAGLHASIAQYLIEHQAQNPKSMAALIRVAVSFLSVFAVKQGCRKFSNEEGLNYLRKLGLVDGDPHEASLPHFNINSLALDESVRASEALARPTGGLTAKEASDTSGVEALTEIRKLAQAVARGEDIEVPANLAYAVNEIMSMAEDMAAEEKDLPSGDAELQAAMLKEVCDGLE